MIDRTSALEIDVSWESEAWSDRAAVESTARRAAQAAFTGAKSQTAARAKRTGAELSVVFADDCFIQSLNHNWRGKDRPTNVLSFPAMDDVTPAGMPVHLGDVVVARETLAAEAVAQKKPFHHHLAHLICHGTLHLLQYDHMADTDAGEMESLETEILAKLGIPDPYASGGQHTPANRDVFP